MKIFLMAIILISGIQFTSIAQIKKGSIFWGGQIGYFTQTTTTDQKSTGFNLAPAWGEAVKDNLILGFDAVYGYSQNSSNNPFNQTFHNYGGGAFLRKYSSIGKGFYLFGQARLGASYNRGIIDQSIPTIHDVVKGYSVDLGIYPGVSYQISNKLQLETGFNNLVYFTYQHNKDTQTISGIISEKKANTLSLGTSLNNLASFNLGLRLLIVR